MCNTFSLFYTLLGLITIPCPPPPPSKAFMWMQKESLVARATRKSYCTSLYITDWNICSKWKKKKKCSLECVLLLSQRWSCCHHWEPRGSKLEASYMESRIKLFKGNLLVFSILNRCMRNSDGFYHCSTHYHWQSKLFPLKHHIRAAGVCCGLVSE